MAREEGTGRQLRRHGDELQRLPNGYYVANGRVDDTMNLGGIKVPPLLSCGGFLSFGKVNVLLKRLKIDSALQKKIQFFFRW